MHTHRSPPSRSSGTSTDLAIMRSAVKSFLLVLMMLILPLNAAYAARSAYAHHGEGEALHHSVLHKLVHDHHGQGSHSERQHHHCGFSHTGGVLALIGVVQFANRATPTSYDAPRSVVHLPMPPLRRPDRPKWAAAAT